MVRGRYGEGHVPPLRPDWHRLPRAPPRRPPHRVGYRGGPRPREIHPECGRRRRLLRAGRSSRRGRRAVPRDDPPAPTRQRPGDPGLRHRAAVPRRRLRRDVGRADGAPLARSRKGPGRAPARGPGPRGHPHVGAGRGAVLAGGRLLPGAGRPRPRDLRAARRAPSPPRADGGAPAPDLPHDCVDGFLGAYWRRPEAYLDAAVRGAISTFTKLADVEPGLARLRRDLEDGTWRRRNAALG